MQTKLTKADIAALLSNPTEDLRAGIAEKVGNQVEAGGLTGQERHIAHDILRIMVRDAAERVRDALAKSLAFADDLPSDVANRIARDLDAIAVPFLETTPSLSDEELIAIVRSGSDAKSVAIAGRPTVSIDVSDVIAAEAGKEAVKRLLDNAGAEISNTSYDRVVDRWGEDEEVSSRVAAREALPLAVAERLVSLVSDEVRAHLIDNHNMSEDLAARVAVETRENATIGLLDGLAGVESMTRFVEKLHISGRLTPTLVLRAACLGEMRFVEAALGQLARIPADRAWTLVHDAGRLGLRALFVRAGLPQALYQPLRIAVDVYHETALDGRVHDREHFRRTIIERVLTKYQDLEGDDLDFLLYQISRQAQVMRNDKLSA